MIKTEKIGRGVGFRQPSGEVPRLKKWTYCIENCHSVWGAFDKGEVEAMDEKQARDLAWQKIRAYLTQVEALCMVNDYDVHFDLGNMGEIIVKEKT